MKRNLDRELWNTSALFCGVDEAGRGALAGPVVAAAVILPGKLEIEGVDDSKRLTPRKRAELFDTIKQLATGWAIAASSHTVIDRHNILAATWRAMRRAVSRLRPRPGLVLVDGWAIPDLDIACNGIVRGDSKSQSIACASILAKVFRDRLMTRLDKRYPGYGLARHKGYPTREHIAALSRLGVTRLHRRTFAPVARCLETD